MYPLSYARNPAITRHPTHSVSTCSALQRSFSTTRAAQRILPKFPLHDAVKDGNLHLVKRIINETLLGVNEENAYGELPLVIAAEKRNEKILRILQEYGACYFLTDKKGKSAFEYVERTLTGDDLKKKLAEGYNPKEMDSNDVTAVKEEANRQRINGCGFSIVGCLKNCAKRESKNYSASLKATIAYDSLLTILSLEELAEKYEVQQWEIIKWRFQAREALIPLFEQIKSEENKKSPFTKDEVVLKAKEVYSGNDCAMYHAYVIKVLENGILDDPKAYMQAWEKRRGYTEEYRMPEDSVMAFFKQVLYL